MKVNFNIISIGAIYKKQSLEKRYCLFYFVLGFVCFTSAEKFLYRVFARNIPGIVRDHVKVYISFLSLGIQSQKSSSWSTSLTMKYISQENDSFKSHICISPLSWLWFLVSLWIHEPNASTKGSWTLNSLYKKLYFNFIVSIRSKFLANWVIGRT